MGRPITVADLARAAMKQVAPAESGALEVYIAAYEQDPRIVDVAERDGADSTGFGEILDSVVPYVVVICHFILEQVAAGAAVDSAKEGLRKRTESLFTRFRKRRVPELDTQAARRLTPDQLREIRASAYRKARQMQMSHDQSELLADAIVGAIAASE